MARRSLAKGYRLAVAGASLAVLAGMGTMAASSPTVGAAATTADPGITATSVSVGQVDTLSGPVPGLFEGAKDGTQAYIDYINSKGGVNGRKLHLDVDDDGFSSANYATETQQLVKKDFALVGGFSLFDNAGVPAINAAKIPDVTFSLTKQREEDQYNYSPDPVPTGGSRLGPLKYYKQKFPQAVKNVGTLYTDVSAAAVQSKAVFSAMKSIGYKITYVRAVGPFETDFVADILKMRSDGVKMVYIVGLSVEQTADVAQAIHQEGLQLQVFSTNGVAYDSSYIPDATTAAANGTESDLQTALYAGQDAKRVPAVALFDKWIKKVNPQAHLDVYGVYGWASAQEFAQALKAAGKNPTRQSLIAQLNKITSFNAGGLIATANPAQKKPPTCWVLAAVKNGKWQRVSPSPKTGYVCKPGGFYYPPGYHFTRQS